MKNTCASLLLIALLTACTTAEERAEEIRLQDLADVQTCKSYGLKEGSEAFGNCRLQIDLARQQRYNAPYFYGSYGYGYRGSNIGIGHRF